MDGGLRERGNKAISVDGGEEGKMEGIQTEKRGN